MVASIKSPNEQAGEFHPILADKAKAFSGNIVP
jgi:hypothetical protein